MKKVNFNDNDNNMKNIISYINLYEVLSPMGEMKETIKQIKKKLLSNNWKNESKYDFVKNSTIKDVIYQILYFNNMTLVDNYLKIIPHKIINIISFELSKKINQLLDNNQIKLINFQKNIIENPKINPLISGHLKFNGCNIMPENSNNIMWSEIPAYQYLSHTPNTGINLYSWSLDPFLYQPTGAANLTKIDKFESIYDVHPLVGTKYPATITSMVMNINIIRYMSGLCGKAWIVN